MTSSYDAACESGFSGILCAIPNNQGQARVGAAALETGIYQKSGKGKNATITFVTATAFSQGDEVVFRVTVLDEATQLPVPNAKVDIDITRPETVQLTAVPSDAGGTAEAASRPRNPARKGQEALRRAATRPSRPTSRPAATSGTV